MHKNLICKASPFFQKALNNNWKEAKDGAVSLPTDSFDVVHCYVRWIYYKKVIIPPFQGDENDKKNDDSDPVQDFLADCYVFGDKVQDIDFKDVVVDTCSERSRNTRKLSSRMINAIYEHTQETSPARKLYVDLLVSLENDQIFRLRNLMKEVT